MSNEEAIGIESTVVERMRNLGYQVEMTGGHRILAYVAGKIRVQSRRVLVGDTVGSKLSPTI
jgi:translation initiation factor IF-1